MVTIRLARGGKRNDPFYRIVAIESSRKRSGKALDILGHWHPRTKEKKVNKKGISEWVKNGAQVSDAVKSLLK